MSDIVASSRNVTDIMTEVVDASVEQSTKLEEVTADITHTRARSVRPVSRAVQGRALVALR